MSTMRERWVAWMAEAGFTGATLAQDAVKAAMNFAESEVALALQPREVAPELDALKVEASVVVFVKAVSPDEAVESAACGDGWATRDDAKCEGTSGHVYAVTLVARRCEEPRK